jgi:hypothetical protein
MQAANLARSVAAAALAAAVLAACAPTPAPGPVTGGGGLSSTFSAADFAWSTQSGATSVDGRVDYRAGGQDFDCIGSVGLIPETPYTRHRFLTLYQSLDHAAVPAGVVRSRSGGEASSDYRAYERSTTCGADGGFAFQNLPAGGWFVIAPVRAGSGEPVVLMRRIETGARGTVRVTLD